MSSVAASVVLFVAASAAELSPTIVGAPGAPVRLERAKVLNIGAEEPPVLLYAATNPTDETYESFTVIAFIFDAQGTLKARQIAPGRHMLEKRSTKYSTMVLDGSPIAATDLVVVGVDQALPVGTDTWWRAELEQAAKEAAKRLVK